ncbi:MAG: hypothetical protein C4K60_01395 [Ideonella sp. MAG2]|nr:MAG: hypothetical protein C4K60_01395 [Ideonella sp. MAG2]
MSVPDAPMADRRARSALADQWDLREGHQDASLMPLVTLAAQAANCPSCLLGLFEADGVVRPLAWQAWSAEAAPQGNALRALWGTQASIVSVADARLKPLLGSLLAGDERARFAVAVPVEVDGEVVAAFWLKHPDPGGLASSQCQSLEALAALAATLLIQARQRREADEHAQRMHDLARVSSDWMWEADAQGRCSWISGDLYSLTGIHPRELIGNPLPPELLVDDQGRPLSPPQYLSDVLATRQPLSRVLSRWDTAQGPLWLSRSAVPVFDAQGEFVGYRGTARTMSSKLAQEHRQEQDERLQRLSAEVPGALVQFVVPAEGGDPRYLYVSAGLSRWIAPVPEGTTALAPFGPADDMALEDQARWRAALKRSVNSLRPLQVEYRRRSGRGPQRWFETRASAQRLPDGSTVFHGFTADITARRSLEASRLENEVLRREKAAAEAANRAKSEFLSRASHELRTPLNAVVGFAQLMSMDTANPLPPEQAHRLMGLRSAGQRLLDLVNDVLDVARIEAGGFALKKDRVDLGQVVETCLVTMRPMAAAREVVLQANLSEEAAVCGDTMALEQVLINLLSNAIKYNRHGGRVLVNVWPDGEQQVLAVSDQGGGLDAEAQSQLFQPFNRLGAERQRIEGSGLGLVIVRDLVHAMGGKIEVISAPQHGAEFRVLLPRDHRKVAAKAAPVAPRHPLTAPGAASVSMGTVLYIEDEPLNVLLIQEVFRAHPAWTLHVCTDGAAGVAMAQSIQPDLVLVDINLPDISGLEVLGQLRASPQTAGLCCVALSADALPEQISAARVAGFDDYWTKPVDLAQLMPAICRVLEKHASKRA